MLYQYHSPFSKTKPEAKINPFFKGASRALLETLFLFLMIDMKAQYQGSMQILTIPPIKFTRSAISRQINLTVSIAFRLFSQIICYAWPQNKMQILSTDLLNFKLKKK